MGRQIEELARFVAETRCEDIPEAVRRHARLVLLDTLGVILAGSRAARSGGIARAARGDRRHRRDGLRAGLAGARPAHRRAAERHRRPLDRIVRGAAPRLGPGGDAGTAGRAGGRRAGANAPAREMLAAFVLGYDVVGRLAGRLHAAPAGAPERPGVAARRRRCGGAAARPRRRRHQPRDAHRHDAGVDAELHQRRRRRDGAQRRRRDERVCRRAGARTGAGRVRGAGRMRSRRRSGSWSAPASRAERAARRARHDAGRSPATISGSTPAATRSTRRSIASPRRSPSCGRGRSRSRGSTSRPIASPR